MKVLIQLCQLYWYVCVCVVLQISYYSPSLLSHFKTMDTSNSGKVSSHLLQVNELPLSHLPSSTLSPTFFHSLTYLLPHVSNFQHSQTVAYVAMNIASSHCGLSNVPCYIASSQAPHIKESGNRLVPCSLVTLTMPTGRKHYLSYVLA